MSTSTVNYSSTNFTENEELIIDYHDGHLSIWSPVGATLLKR
jgi:hypothetical protein